MSLVAIVMASGLGIGQEPAKELAENGFEIPFPSYKPELRFRALLTDDAREVKFERTPADANSDKLLPLLS